MAHFQMTRIQVPDWARPPDIFLDEMRLADYYAIQEHRTEMLAVVHQEVEKYLNTPALCYENDEDGFPSHAKLNGQYYISDESYTMDIAPVWFHIGIMCHCLEKPWYDGQVEFDYLGLEVWLDCDPDQWSFAVEGTDSSVL